MWRAYGGADLAIYDLSRIGILLVEDNAFISNILEGLLHSFRVGKVTTAKSGEEAIEVLSSPVFATSIDIVMSDLLMSPINGLLLLRWVRNSKESVNRFMPFVMVSGAADRDNVIESRDIGVTEFLAKPFWAESV
jgi:CheY-like chemotaxis protein